MKNPDNLDKQKAMDLAEESRETEWVHPSFVAELFRGNFHWDLIHPYPVQDAADKKIGDEYIEKLRPVLEKHLDPQEVDNTSTVPKAAVKALADVGVFGMKIPKEYEGLGFSQMNYSRVMAFISSYCQSTAVWISAHQSIGVPQPLKIFGTKEQKQKYLPRLAKGEISAFALTEPNVGSDPAKMTTRATKSEDGSYYILNGEKLWCTNGPSADVLVVMAVTEPKIVKGKEKTQITAFIVEADTPGFEVGHLCNFMGIRGISNGLLRFKDMKVPAENIIGAPGMGLKIALTTLNQGRLTIPATTAAAGKLAVHFSKDWANERVQWGQPIGNHQAVGVMLANISADTFAMDSMNWLTCAMVDKGGADIRLEAAMAKYYSTETGWRVADDFLQVRGGRGYETSDSLLARGELPIPAERMMRDARISRIIEGTSEIMRLFIAREAMDTHVRLAMPIFKGKDGKLGPIMKAAKFYASWYPKQWLPASSNFGVKHLDGANQAHLAYIGTTAKKLARELFAAMRKYKLKLEYEQLIMQRFVDIGTDLFAMAACLSHAEHLLGERGKDEKLQRLVDLFCSNARGRISDNFRSVKKNHNSLINKVSAAFMEGGYQWMVEDVYTDVPPLQIERVGKMTSQSAGKTLATEDVPAPQETPQLTK